MPSSLDHTINLTQTSSGSVQLTVILFFLFFAGWIEQDERVRESRALWSKGTKLSPKKKNK